MSVTYEIPLVPSTPQRFTVSLSGVSYIVTARWNNQSNLWTIDIADANGNAMISGYPLVTGADLLEQFDYMGFTGSLYAQTDSDPTAPPTFSNLGVTGHLYYITSSASG